MAKSFPTAIGTWLTGHQVIAVNFSFAWFPLIVNHISSYLVPPCNMFHYPYFCSAMDIRNLIAIFPQTRPRKHFVNCSWGLPLRCRLTGTRPPVFVGRYGLRLSSWSTHRSQPCVGLRKLVSNLKSSNENNQANGVVYWRQKTHWMKILRTSENKGKETNNMIDSTFQEPVIGTEK